MAAIHTQKAEYRKKISDIMRRRVSLMSHGEAIEACLDYHRIYTYSLSVGDLKSLYDLLKAEEEKRDR